MGLSVKRELIDKLFQVLVLQVILPVQNWVLCFSSLCYGHCKLPFQNGEVANCRRAASIEVYAQRGIAERHSFTTLIGVINLILL
jgi:hypothetical protein